jgi:hypothetical protein
MSETKFIASPQKRLMKLFIMLLMQSSIIVSRKLILIRIEGSRHTRVTTLDQPLALVPLRWIYLPSLPRVDLSRLREVLIQELALQFVDQQAPRAIILVSQVTGPLNAANLERFGQVHLSLGVPRKVDQVVQKTNLPTKCGSP